MLDHVTIRVADLITSRAFYSTALAGEPRGAEFLEWDESDEAFAEFHRVATQAGFTDNGGPGERPEYHAGYWAPSSSTLTGTTSRR